MAKGDEKRAQKMIDVQGGIQAQRNQQLYDQNYQQYQPGVGGGGSGPGSVGGGTTGGGGGGGGTGGGGDIYPPAPGADPSHPGRPQNPTGQGMSTMANPNAPQGIKQMTNAGAQAFFDRMFPGENVTPEELEAHRAELEAAGFTLNPNARGLITDLTLPSGDTVDPIYGAGSGVNRKQWLVHPGAGGELGGAGGLQGKNDSDFQFSQRYNPYGQGLLAPGLGGYRNFIESGGFSPQDIQAIRARSNAPIRSAYEQGMDDLTRQRNVAGGYMPNYGAAMAKMQRQMSNKIGDQSLNTEAEIATQIRQGRLAGLQGFSDLGSDINRQGLASQQLQGNQGLGLIGAQIEKSGVRTNFQNSLANVGGAIDVIGRGAKAGMGGSL